MRQLSQLPDGEAKVRAVKLEPHLDRMVHEHMKAHGYASLSAALRDLVDRGLATLGFMGPGADQKARAYREAARSVEAQMIQRVRDSLKEFAKEHGASAPDVPRRVEPRVDVPRAQQGDARTSRTRIVRR